MHRKLPGRQGVASKEAPSAPTLKAGAALLASPSWQQSLVDQVRLACRRAVLGAARAITWGLNAVLEF